MSRQSSGYQPSPDRSQRLRIRLQALMSSIPIMFALIWDESTSFEAGLVVSGFGILVIALGNFLSASRRRVGSAFFTLGVLLVLAGSALILLATNGHVG